MQTADVDEPLVDAIYGIAIHEGDWNPALNRFRVLLNSCESSLTVFDRKQSLLAQDTACRMITDGMRQSYVRHYGALDPKVPILMRRGAGFLFNDADHFDEEFVGRDPFYQEFSRSIGTRHTLDMLMRKDHQKVIYLAAMRSSRRGPYDQAAAGLFRRASRHFLRALELKEKLAFAARAASALDQLSVPVVVIDAHGRIEIANGPARSMFAANGALRVLRGKLSASPAGMDHRLQEAIAQALAGARQPAVLRIPRGGDGAWILWIMPLPEAGPLVRPSAAALLVVKADSACICLDVSELTAIYGFTRAEAELAVALGNGETLNEVAARRNVKSSTVRTQLLSVLDKMGLHRQADLTRTLASLSRPLGGTAVEKY